MPFDLFDWADRFPGDDGTPRGGDADGHAGSPPIPFAERPETRRAGAPPGDHRRLRGAMSHRRGASAEQQVQDSYARRGYSVAATRWRGRGGEIDLILRRGGTSIFVEVKAARDADTALSRIRPAQIARIHAAASEYLGTLPDGSLSETRFDAACVDGYGRVTIHENILAHP